MGWIFLVGPKDSHTCSLRLQPSSVAKKSSMLGLYFIVYIKLIVGVQNASFKKVYETTLFEGKIFKYKKIKTCAMQSSWTDGDFVDNNQFGIMKQF